jgi:hypothetical protein
MAVYADAESLYASLRRLFDQIQVEDPAAADAILASRLVIGLHCTAPSAQLTIDGRRRPVQTTFGPSSLRPTLHIELATGTLHQILLGELSLTAALGSGQLKVRGPVWKAMALADLFRRGQKIYPALLRERGRIPVGTRTDP